MMLVYFHMNLTNVVGLVDWFRWTARGLVIHAHSAMVESTHKVVR